MGSPTNYPRPHLEPASGPACPKCASKVTKELKYTWWGGVIGPRVFNLSKCLACGCQFNRKTGKDALQAIIIYNVVAVVIVVAILLAANLGR